MKFVSLHHHTTFSYGDGYAKPEEHVQRAAELGMKAIAFTEHGNTSSHVQLERAALKYDIKPIYGVEFYTAADLRSRRKWHLTVLAMNQTGYSNLNQLVSRSYAEGFYQWPTITGEMLAEHQEGLIVLSGCADSYLACTLLGGKDTKVTGISAAQRVMEKFRALFGDRYYLEVQAFPELERTRTLNAWYELKGRQLGIPIVATGDVHYPHPDDNAMQVTLHAASRGGNSAAEQASSWEYDIRLTHPTSDRQILRRMMATDLDRRSAWASIENTAEIASRCDVTLPRSPRMRYPLPAGQTAGGLIWEWLRDGWRFRYERNPEMRRRYTEYSDRIKYEMSLITEKDFIDYFLMLSDVVRLVKDKGEPVGPARGSAAASLVCYLLRITEVDPMVFPTMVFERFIDITREDLPDIDLDFTPHGREIVRQRLIELWGKEKVGNIGNFTRYRGKNSIDDVARVHKVPHAAAAIVKNLVIERSGGDSRFDASLGDTFAMFPQAAKILEAHPVLEQAIRLEGNYKGMSVHAAGLVVSNIPLTDICAVYEREVGKEKRRLQAIAYDKEDADYLGMMKIDALSLSTMEVISRTLREIGMSLDDLYQVPLTEPTAVQAFHDGDVIGIFQFEGRATRLVNAQVRPDNFTELADINALSRPGPLFSGATAQYVDVKHGRQEPEHLHPVVDEITSWSQYQIIYQEQILRIVREVGGFPWTHASEIRRIISKKKGEAAFNVMWERFRDGAAKLHGIDEELALKIWKSLVTSGTYAFNVAHCVSYSMLGFWCQWLKQHHTTAFYASALDHITGRDPEEKARNLQRLLRDAERHGVDVRPPDLARSHVTWRQAEPGVVVAGFSQVPGIGPMVAGKVVAEREAATFEAWPDLIRVKGIGPKMMEKIREFAESDDPFGLEITRTRLDAIRHAISKGQLRLPTPTHKADDIPLEGEDWMPVVWLGIVRERQYKDLMEDERARSGDDEADILKRIRDPHLLKSAVLRCYDEGDEEVYARISRWRFPMFEETLEGIDVGEDIVLIIGKRRPGFGLSVFVDRMVVLAEDEEEEAA